MILLVYGGRNWAEITVPRGQGAEAVAAGRAVAQRQRQTLYAALDSLHNGPRGPVELLVHGGASGADSCARGWAYLTRVKEKCFKAEWSKHGRAAGPIRNTRMALEGGFDVAIGFPGGAGTADMRGKLHAMATQQKPLIMIEVGEDGGMTWSPLIPKSQLWA